MFLIFAIIQLIWGQCDLITDCDTCSNNTDCDWCWMNVGSYCTASNNISHCALVDVCDTSVANLSNANAAYVSAECSLNTQCYECLSTSITNRLGCGFCDTHVQGVTFCTVEQFCQTNWTYHTSINDCVYFTTTPTTTVTTTTVQQTLSPTMSIFQPKIITTSPTPAPAVDNFNATLISMECLLNTMCNGCLSTNVIQTLGCGFCVTDTGETFCTLEQFCQNGTYYTSITNCSYITTDPTTTMDPTTMDPTTIDPTTTDPTSTIMDPSTGDNEVSTKKVSSVSTSTWWIWVIVILIVAAFIIIISGLVFGLVLFRTQQ